MMLRFGDLVVWPIITSWPGGLDFFAPFYVLNIPMPAAKRKEKSGVSIIGTGRLGTTLAVALAAKGYSIRSLVARRVQNARKAAKLLDAEVQVLAAKQLRTLIDADLFLITVPDDQIAGVVCELSEINADQKRTALHTSGALSSDVLEPLRKKGWHTGSIHPLMSISSPDDSLRGAFWSVEGDRTALRLGKEIVRDLDGKSFSIKSEDKPLYHAAAVMVSGNVVALFDVALEMLGQCGLDRKTARAVLLPLIVSSVRNLETKTPEASLTGTFSRGDVETVKRHLAAMRDPKVRSLYQILGERSLQLAKLDKELSQKVRKVLLTGLQD